MLTYMKKKSTKTEKNKEKVSQEETLQDQSSTNENESNEEQDNAQDDSESTDPVQQERDKYLRLYSEFENFRRRTTKERLDLLQNASKDLMLELLPIIDDMERAILALSGDENASAKEGMELIFKKFYGTLEKKGLKPMEAKGEAFDSEIHEAVTQFDAPSNDMVGKVIDEVEKGYYLNDKVLRFAKVVVGK